MVSRTRIPITGQRVAVGMAIEYFVGLSVFVLLSDRDEVSQTQLDR